MLAMLAGASANAQVIADVIFLEKLTRYEQTSGTAPVLNTGYDDGAYRFDVSILNFNDDDVSGITPPVVSLAAGSTAPDTIPTAHNGGTLIYNSGGGDWRYGAPDGFGWNATSTATLDTLFADGAHSINLQGSTYSLDNSGHIYPGVVPTVTMTGGFWSGGKYVIDVNQALTIATTVFSDYSTAGIGGFVNLNVDDVNSIVHLSRIAPSGFITNELTNSATMTIAAGTLVAGQDYYGFANFSTFVDQDTQNPLVFSAALWGNETNFTLQAIPEPSTYALMGTGLAIMALLHRRRRPR